MNESEKKALLDAFDIPDPQKKAAFVSEFNEKAKNVNAPPKIRMSRVFRYSSIAAVAVIALGIAGHFALDRNFNDKFNNNEVDNAVVVTTSEPDETAETDAVSATSQTASTVTTTAQTVIAEKTKKSSSAKTEHSTKTTQKSTSKTTASEEKNSAKDTSSSKTSSTKENDSKTTSVESTAGTTSTSEVHSVDQAAPNGFPGNYTVSAEYYYSPPTEQTNVIALSQLKSENSPDSIPIPEFSLDSLYDQADYVFSASIDEVLYTDSGNKFVYAQHNVTISNCYKGSYRLGDKVSIFFRGGYMPAWIYAMNNRIDVDYTYDDYVYDDLAVYGDLEVGESYIFFVSIPDSHHSHVVPEGALLPSFYEQVGVFTDSYPECCSVGRSWMSFKVEDLEIKKSHQYE